MRTGLVNRYAAALSQHPLPAHAVGEVAGQVLDQLDGDDPDLLVCFASAHLVGALDDVVHALGALLTPRVLLGTTASGVLGGTHEAEDGIGFAVFAACLPGAVLEPVWLRSEETPDGPTVVGWPERAVDAEALVLAADPFSFPVERVLERIDAERPGLHVLGGLASGASRPGGNRFLLDGRIHADGAAGVLIGGVGMRTVVSQGCRPVGQPFVVTKRGRRSVEELGGRPALERLRELAEQADDEERRLLEQGVLAGVVVDEHLADFGPGDFLVRGIVGVDRETGAIGMGEPVEVGQTFQFHVRDATTADEDLRARLAHETAGGALLFTCNGRGRTLFGERDHDTGVIVETLGPVPVAGMFCAGELGPVGARNAVHSFTASLALFP
ncbi:MAG: FIST N-terminal domain-containing protein [Actinomycetota bacterium]